MARAKAKETKYRKYILSDSIVEGPARRKVSSPYVAAVGDFWKELSGVNCNFAFSYIKEPHLMPEGPHTHDNDEFLFFVSGNPDDVQDLGAEVEIAFGEEWEKNTITTSSIVYLPKGLRHCPINVKKVDRPFLFGHIWNVLPQAEA